MRLDLSSLEKEVNERGSIETLDNGLTLITENARFPHLMRGELVLFTGAGYEDDADLGAIHMLEHLCLFSPGSFRSLEERNMALSKMGMTINASTTQFAVTYPVQSDNVSKYLLLRYFPDALRLVSDSAFSPVITEETVATQKKDVLVELATSIQSNRSNPWFEINEQIRERLNSKNPLYNRKTIGTEDTISNLSAQSLKDYHSRLFNANNAMVSVVGDLTPETRSAIIDICNHFPVGDKVPPLVLVPEDQFQTREIMEFDSPVEGMASVNIYFRVPPQYSVEYENMRVLGHILGGGLNSLLYKELRLKRNLVYSIGINSSGHERSGLLNINYSIPQESLEESLEAVDVCIERLRQGDFSPDYMAGHRAVFLPLTLSELYQPGWIINELVFRNYMEKFGYQNSWLDITFSHQECEKKDSIAAANKYLGEERLTTIAK